MPTPNVSIVDLVVDLEKEITAEAINQALKEASEGELKGILEYTEEPLVSSDFIGNSHSAIVDGQLTMVVGDSQAKIMAWYDNEWGYSCRVVDLVKLLVRSLNQSVVRNVKWFIHKPGFTTSILGLNLARMNVKNNALSE